jgi:hypothetical protein
VDQRHRRQRVDLAAEGQLAAARHDHHHNVHLIVTVRLDLIAHAEADQIGLQVFPI